MFHQGPAMFVPLVLSLFVVFNPHVLGDDLHKVQDILNQIVSGHYYNDGEQDPLNAIDSQLQEERDVIIPSTVLRDEEHLPYNPLWRHQYLSGGAGEGDQYLGPEGTIPNTHQVKSDSMLPAYCDPPNPCPDGYTAADGCLEDVPNTAEFSRDFQSQQNCPCDPEHMFDCAMTASNAINNIPVDGAHATVRGKKFSEKKSGNGFADSYNERHPRSVDAVDHAKINPYLQGQPLPVIAKKAPHIKEPFV
ncbi:hypothetical protein RvY_17733 [Ramazzottius varieornatus]|uniref:Neuroendocrine protein 7B2 n=1 Tax=Ramazzottius varieornatus TaxID=947166 RepID=A0A1D1W346_RAMVA|nr:hypothetical protein RvY_17733 [Ramazzottius varieornatus]